jgi:hypothetical protein
MTSTTTASATTTTGLAARVASLIPRVLPVQAGATECGTLYSVSPNGSYCRNVYCGEPPLLVSRSCQP